MKLIVQASRDRRRGGMGFTKGQNGPFEEDDNTEDGWMAINDDPYLTIKPFKEDQQVGDDENTSTSQTTAKSKPKPRGKSAAEKRAEKLASQEQKDKPSTDAKGASSEDANTNNAG